MDLVQAEDYTLAGADVNRLGGIPSYAQSARIGWGTRLPDSDLTRCRDSLPMLLEIPLFRQPNRHALAAVRASSKISAHIH